MTATQIQPKGVHTLTAPQTLFAMAGFEPKSPRLDQAVLVMIDFQNEYRSGPLRLAGVEAAIDRAAALLAAARRAGTKIIHVAHKGAPGGPFDRTADRGAFITELAPAEAEDVVEKPRPNAFSGTDLAARIGEPGTPVIFAGFMTHMCLSSTVRAALDLGYPATVAADACTTRDLPTPHGGVVAAAALHDAELAALSDRFAAIATVAGILG